MRRITRKTTLRAGIKKVIHINGHVLRRNKQRGRKDPCITVQCTDGVFYGRRVKLPASELGQHFDRPRSNGAVVWIETRGKVEVYA